MAEDFSKFGKPVEAVPTEDFSSFGKPVESTQPSEPSVWDKIKQIYAVPEALAVGAVSTFVPPLMSVASTAADSAARKAAELTTGLDVPGESLGQRYMKSFERYSGLGEALHEQMTPGGQVLLDTMGRILDAGVKGLGDIAYSAQRALEANPIAAAITGLPPVPIEKSLAPIVGTAAQVAGTGALFAAPVGRGGKKVMTGDFAKDYPTVNAAIEASHIGDSPVSAAVKAAPERPITEIIHEQLNKEMGLGNNNPLVQELSMADKLKQVITITAAKTGERVSPADMQRYVNTVVGAVEDMQKRQDVLTSQAAVPKALPMPTVLDEPIIVDPQGRAGTGAQWAENAMAVERSTPESMAAQIGVGYGAPALGPARAKLDAYIANETVARQRPSAGTENTAKQAYSDLKKYWEDTFATKDTKALDTYIARKGDMSFNEILSMMGKKTKQSGILALDAEALQKSAKNLEHLGEGVVKFAAAGLVKEPNWNNRLKPNPDGTVTMYRGTRAGQDTKLGPGAWMTPDKMIADSIYAKGRGGQAVGVVTEHKVPLKELVYAHTDGYIYAPKGTDLGQVIRYRDTKGDPITFNDLLPYQEAKVTTLITKPVREFHKDLRSSIIGRAEKMQDKVDTYTDWQWDTGMRVKSERTNQVYKITGRSWDMKNDRPMYRYESASGESGQFIATKAHETLIPMFGPKAQRGALGVGGVEKLAAKTEEAAKAAIQKGWVLPNPEAAADRVKRVMEDNRIAMENSRKANAGQFIKNARRLTIAHDYDLRAALKQTPAGQQALHREVVRNGATMAAKIHMDAANAKIFDRFKHDELQTIDEITRLRRIVQIDKYRGIGSTRHEGGVTGPEAAARLKQMEDDMGHVLYNKYRTASDNIFLEEKKLLKLRLDKGIISQESFNKMKDLDYTRTEYIDAVDPSIPIHSRIKNMPMSIRGSGIPELGHGKMVGVNIDSQGLLMEDMARAYNTVFKNDALLALRELANRELDNGIVRMPPKAAVTVDGAGNMKMKHTPEGWTAIGVRVDGKQEFILMKDEFAEQFVARPEASLSEYMATVFRIASGTSAIKYTSTGANPAFALAGIPMDIWHTWVASTGTYSPHLPVYLAQMGKDMTKTAGDAWGKKGSWIDAMNEGIGSSYMTHESRGLTDPTKTIRGVMAPRMQKIREALSYVNETSDMWIRLAYRNRLIEQGVPSWEATAMARDRLDYYQGGPIAKALDAIIPYTNVAIQATAKGAEHLIKPIFKDVPEQFALSGVKEKYTPRQEALIKMSWVVGTAAAMKIASMVTSPETDKAIPVADKVRGFNITFGDNFFILDPNGNKRFFYVPIRLDQTVMPFNAAVVGGLEKAEYGKVPRGLATAAVGQISPISQEIPIPSIEAIASYAHNYDSFTDSPVYKGPKVIPEAEVRTFGQGEPTNPLAVAAGQALGMSPVRLENSFGKVVNYNNMYIKLMGGLQKGLFEGANPRDQAKAAEQIIQSAPGLSSILKLTSPSIQAMQDMMEAEAEVNTPKVLATRGIDDLIFQYEHKQNNVTQKTLETYINNQPSELRKALVDHMKYTVQVNKIMTHYKASEGIPSRSWWITASKIPGEARAEVFYNEWVSSGPEERKKMLNIANALQQAGTGFMSDDFQRAFIRERKMLGDEQR